MLGYEKTAQVAVGGAIRIAFELTNTQPQAQDLLVDLAVFYVKGSGQARAKVFKLKIVELAPGQTAQFVKKLSLTEMTTRTHYPGLHKVNVMLNGQAQPLGFFELMKSNWKL